MLYEIVRHEAKQNTPVERKAKESPFEIRQEIREAHSGRLEQFFIHK